MPEKISAGGLRNSLRGIFNRRLRGAEESSLMPAESLAVPPVVPLAGEASVASVTPAPEAEQTVTPGPTVTEAPPAQELAPASGLPDWLSAPSPAEPTPTPISEMPEVWISPQAPMPAPEAPSALPAVEAPVVEAPVPAVAVEAKTEADPFSVNREFNGYMETIRQAQAVLASGIALNSEEQKKALIAVARSNSLLPKLPPEVLESVLLMRVVASGNPKFGREDFQMEMLAAMEVIKTGTAVKG